MKTLLEGCGFMRVLLSAGDMTESSSIPEPACEFLRGLRKSILSLHCEHGGPYLQKSSLVN